ncbi:MAG: hypothetical protein QOK47_1435 [Actinomycetota bacterium]|nr:hypothetical protein [Actinomycetota bacterium]
MAGSRFERLFDDLDAGLEAAIAHEEEEAANDLARALRQDADLRLALARAGWRVKLSDESSLPVDEVGTNYAAVTSASSVLLVPLGRAIFISDPGSEPPQISHGSLLELLRRQVRAGSRVELVSDAGTFSGTLLAAAPDHLHLTGRSGDVLLAARSIRAVRYALA